MKEMNVITIQTVKRYALTIIFWQNIMSLPVFPTENPLDPSTTAPPVTSTGAETSLFKPNLFGSLPTSLFMRVHQAASAVTAPMSPLEDDLGETGLAGQSGNYLRQKL